MTAVKIRSIRNKTDGEVTLINLAEIDKPWNKVTLSAKGWEGCEVNIPRCETNNDWRSNHRISLELKRPEPSKIWIFQTGEQLCYCTTTEFSDRHHVRGDPGVEAEEDRYLVVNDDGSFVIIKASFWLYSKWLPNDH